MKTFRQPCITYVIFCVLEGKFTEIWIKFGELMFQFCIGNSRLLGNFVTIGIGKFQGCNIGLLKSNDLITLYMKLSQIFMINLLILTESYNFVNFSHVCNNQYWIEISAVWNLKLSDIGTLLKSGDRYNINNCVYISIRDH